MHAVTDHQLSIADQALRWFVRFRSGDATIADTRQFESWVKSDLSHQQEFEKISRLWVDLDETKPLLVEELIRVVGDGKFEAHRSLERCAGRWITYGLSTALAASLMLFIAVGWWMVDRPETAGYRTAKGEQRTVAFPDGSRMILNTDTAVTTRLSSSRSAVILHRGEAFFVVSHDKQKSFEVEAGRGVVRDIGTQFTVRRQLDQVTVTVVEGAVEVQGPSEKVGIEPGRLLTAGDKTSYGAGGSLAPVEKIDIAASTAWMEGKLLFDHRPLTEVIQEIGRYQEGEIRVLDPRLNDLKVSGVFGVGDRDGFLLALETAIPVKSTRVNTDLVILEKNDFPFARR
ncbi:MAG: FecR family protein [Nitrospirota bacterium]